MTVGLEDTEKFFYSAAAGVGNPVVYVGSKTGRDGIHGATMASAEFTDDSEEKRPTVQVGDPFTEKLLLEACLELMAEDAIVAIQDMGAAGLTSSSVEMASKGGVGIELDLDHVPQRETGMTAYEMMLSESQERMLMVLKPGSEARAEAIFRKWDLDFAVIGRITDTNHLVIRHKGKVMADIPLAPLADSAPVYDRPWVPTPPRPEIDPASVEAPVSVVDALKTLIGSGEVGSLLRIGELYDHLGLGDSARRPGGDAAVVRVHGTSKGLAVTTDCTPRYCGADPRRGGAQAVAETWRNITAVGARPLAITDCMNFANPQRPEVMGQFVGCIEGMADACRELDYPVVSGNVSLYNETNGVGILPTPAIGGVGLIDDVEKLVSLALTADNNVLVLIGETRGHLGSSVYLRDVCNRRDGAPPPVDLAAERRNGDFVRGLIHDGLVKSAHDLSDGGLLVGVAEMAIAGDRGAVLEDLPADIPAHAFLFGEDQARYVLEVESRNIAAITEAAAAAGVPARVIGRTGGKELKIEGHGTILIEELRQIHEGWLPSYMSLA